MPLDNLIKLFLLSLILQFGLILQRLDGPNSLFFFFCLIVVVALKFYNYSLPKIIKFIILALILYIQFKFEGYTITKDYFINCLYLLLLFKFEELKKKHEQFFFVFCNFFITIASLINNQNLISTLLSFSLLIINFISLYLINQSDVFKINLKNFKKILLIATSIVPVVIITYIVFPRAKIHISLFEQKNQTLGIPEKINLGSFDQLTSDNTKIFDIKFIKQIVNQNNQYFRVRVFSSLNENKEWLPINSQLIFRGQNQFSKQVSEMIEYDLTLIGHNKEWIPMLDYALPQYTYNYNEYDHTYQFNDKNLNTTRLRLQAQITPLIKTLLPGEKNYYLQLPNSINPSLIKWAKDNSQNKTSEEFARFILNHFNKEEFYYDLRPARIGNDYAKFFFETKTGYCEYYAGTLAILLRAANIPSRIVTGFYAGQYNKVGDFFSYTQTDAHAWVEYFIDNQGWIRIDPTLAIPDSRIKNTVNEFLNINENQNNQSFSLIKSFKKSQLILWVQYLDYRWTNYLINYDRQFQLELFSKIKKLDLHYIFYNKTFLFIILFINMTLCLLFLYYLRSKNYSALIYQLLLKKFNLQQLNLTHAKVFKQIQLRLNKNLEAESNILKEILQKYEKCTFGNESLSFLQFLNLFYRLNQFKY